MRRVAGVTVTAHYCPIQDKDADWYRQFQARWRSRDRRALPATQARRVLATCSSRARHALPSRRPASRPRPQGWRAGVPPPPPLRVRPSQVIVLGLDSIEARRWLNAMACSLVAYETDERGVRKPDLSTVIPLVDGGTEGFSGHVRTILPCVSGCFECTLDLFPPQQAVPLCTIAETPRTAAHCILYAHLIEYPKEFPEETPDKDDPAYQNWVYTHALARAKQFNIPGVTLMHTQVRPGRTRRGRGRGRMAGGGGERGTGSPVPERDKLQRGPHRLAGMRSIRARAGMGCIRARARTPSIRARVARPVTGRDQEHHPCDRVDECDRRGRVCE